MENMDTNDALFVPDVNEDSVDIYDGLDINPSTNAEKSSANASPLKDSMDLYEEIITEEQQSKESTYSELKSRFQAAQNQIKELRKRLEQMEMQNTGLNTENYRLKKNLSALLLTARREVTRKDAEIERLNQQSEKFYHPPQSHFNNLRAQSSSSLTSTSSFKTKKPPPPTSSPLPPPPSSLPPPQPPLPASPARDDRFLQEPPQLSRKESNSSTYQPSESCIETRASKSSSHSHLKGSSRGDCDVPEKQTEHSVRKSSSFSSIPHSESDKHKSKHRDDKCPSQKLSESTDRRHRTGSVSNKDCYAPEKNRSHKEDRDTGRRYDSRSCKSRKYLNDEGHHRSERAKSPLPEILHSAASSDDKKRRSRERTQNKGKSSTLDSNHSAAHSSKEGYSRDHRKIRTSDRHIRSVDSKGRKTSPSNQHTECRSDSSKERERDRLSKDYQKKGDRRHENEPGRRHKSSTLSESSKESEKKRSKGTDQCKVDVCSKEIKEKPQEALKRSPEEQSIGVKSSVEENSPNRKLCFMETLNLTLSPIKKPVLPIDSSQDGLTPVNKVTENRPGDKNGGDLEAGLEQPPDTPKTPHSEKTHERFDNVQDKGKKQSETPASGKQLEGQSGQTTSSHSQLLVTAENKMTVPHTQKSPETSSLKAANEGISKTFENRTKLAPDIKLNECNPLEAKHGVSNTSESISELHKSSSSQKVDLGSNTDQPIAVTKPTVLDSNVELKCKTSKTAVEESLPVDSVKDAAAPPRENPVAEVVPDKVDPQSQQISPTIKHQDSKEGLCSPCSSSIHEKVACHMQNGPKDVDAVSSTISLESLPQEGLSLPEAIYILTQTSEDTNDCGSITSEPSSSTGCIAVSKVSSTTEETPLPEKYRDLTYTPKKSFSPAKSQNNNFEPSSSVPVLHDEDSMMRTLSNLKRIPDAISPLRSPIRITKRSHLHAHGKPSHVKSLQKDFSSTAVDVNSKKLDVNKENKYPGSPANHDPQNLDDRVSDLPSSLSDSEVEEGEILSESDEMAEGSSAPATKKVKLARPVTSKPSPKIVLKRKSKERCVTSKEANETTGASTRSPKSRFKTVCPAATKTSFSTIEDVMGTFKLVRSEIRKKYMKLHKIFPKKSFYGVMDNFQESFLEFVDGAYFGQISSQEEELKSKLKKQIASVFSKVSNNGIVKRIFEQQAADLKQKLWDFVDGQVEYLFKDVYTTLKSLCKPTRAQAKENRSSGNEKISRQPPAKKPQCQQKEAQSAPTNMNRVKPCAVVPYKTGLGSRGKDIRITQMEKTSNVESHPTNCPQTVVNFPSPKNVHSAPEESSISSLVVSQNSSLLDKTDFELLTEQQASSLTFNLVRDTQMGEIFKCLLQGSDLLETSGIAGDTTWSLGTPKKDGEKLISITTPIKYDSPSKLLSQTKFDTPSKLIATWSSISPRKMSSPRPKGQIQLNPALFDESCLLEVPSEKSSLTSQRTYSILSEDLAVSLTIPSPLKSDSHLSFLQPPSMHIMSTPDSVISAHISEDALLDGEDATEQDIHLALDTDNSSCASSSSVDSEVLATPFVLKPDLPMQALVMERSNDHFIVKIRQAAKDADTTLTAEDSLSETLIGDHQHRNYGAATQESPAKAVLSDKSQNGTPLNAQPSENTLQSDLAKSSGICQDASSADSHPTQDESLKLTKDPSHEKEDKSIQQNTSKVCFSEDSQKESPKNLPNPHSDKSLYFSAQSSNQFIVQISHATSREGVTVTPDESASQTVHKEEDLTTRQSPSKALVSESDNSLHHPVESSGTNQRSQVLVSDVSDSEGGEMEVSDSERSFTTAKEDKSSTPEKDKRDCGQGNKRKKHHKKSKVKRPRMEKEESTEEKVSNCKKKDSESKSSPASVSPNSLYARNVIRKKGEVVMSWTRDEDHAILTELKTNGASRETFCTLSEKLNKPSEHIAERFYQLMKIFRKQEKMET